MLIEEERRSERRIEGGEDGFDGAETVSKIYAHSSAHRTVATCGIRYVQVVPDSIFEPCERTIVEEGRL